MQGDGNDKAHKQEPFLLPFFHKERKSYGDAYCPARDSVKQGRPHKPELSRE